MSSVRLTGLITLALACASAGCDRQAVQPRAALDIAGLLGGTDTMHARAIEPRTFSFPEDHGPHPLFRSEWWYFTGTLHDDAGRELGYQLTFFRNALADSATFAALPQPRSEWRARRAWMAHFAVTDVHTGEFLAYDRFAREWNDVAGTDAQPLRVQLHDWSVASTSAETFPLRLSASADSASIELLLERGKPVVLQGQEGLSRKSAQPGNASYYYSLTRLPTRGTIRVGGTTHVVEGASWLDREWGTSALADDLAGWDWLSLRLSDTTELMMYRLRRHDGTADPFSAATFVHADGTAQKFTAEQFSMVPAAEWSAADGVTYPIGWQVVIPALELELRVQAAVEDQELNLAVRYWEGLVHARGTRGDMTIRGTGYLELTGYADRSELVRR